MTNNSSQPETEGQAWARRLSNEFHNMLSEGDMTTPYNSWRCCYWCRYFVMQPDENGICRRYPPLPNATDVLVEKGYWCGEWRPNIELSQSLNAIEESVTDGKTTNRTTEAKPQDPTDY